MTAPVTTEISVFPKGVDLPRGQLIAEILTPERKMTFKLPASQGLSVANVLSIGHLTPKEKKKNPPKQNKQTKKPQPLQQFKLLFYSMEPQEDYGLFKDYFISFSDQRERKKEGSDPS